MANHIQQACDHESAAYRCYPRCVEYAESCIEFADQNWIIKYPFRTGQNGEIGVTGGGGAARGRKPPRGP